METKILISLMVVVLPLLGAGIGYLIKYSIEKRKELLAEVTKERRELYQQFVNLIIDIFSSSKTGKQNDDGELINYLFEFYKKYVLYGSPQVINSYADYFQYLYKTKSENIKQDHKTHFRKLSHIVFAMRKDLGLSNKELGKDGEKVFRALLIDFDSIMK